MTTGQFARIINYFCWRQDIDRRGALGYIRNRKTEEKKSSKTAKPLKNSAKPKTAYKTVKNRYNGDKWMGHTEQTKLTLISPKYL